VGPAVAVDPVHGETLGGGSLDASPGEPDHDAEWRGGFGPRFDDAVPGVPHREGNSEVVGQRGTFGRA